MYRWLFVAASALVFGSSLVFPAEGRIPIYQPTTLSTAGGSIDGKYVLTRNISSPSDPALRIIGDDTSNVEIDLNGFTIEVGTGDQPAILATGMRTLVIRNGRALHGGTSGVGAVQVGVVEVRDSKKVRIERVEVVGGSSHHGIFLFDIQNFTVRDNTVLDSGDNGIRVVGDQNNNTKVEGSVENNLIRGVDDRGIEVRRNLATVSIVGNRVHDTGGHGITALAEGDGAGTAAGEAVVVGNKIESAGYRGIIVSGTVACRIADNTVSRSGANAAGVDQNGGDGIYIDDTASNCLVLDNVSSKNVWNGLRIQGDSSHIERNLLNANQRGGLYFQSGSENNTFSGNTARENMAAPSGTCKAQTCPGLSSPDFCEDDTGTSNNTSFEDNLAPGPDRC